MTNRDDKSKVETLDGGIPIPEDIRDLYYQAITELSSVTEYLKYSVREQDLILNQMNFTIIQQKNALEQLKLRRDKDHDKYVYYNTIIENLDDQFIDEKRCYLYRDDSK